MRRICEISRAVKAIREEQDEGMREEGREREGPREMGRECDELSRVPHRRYLTTLQ